MATGVLGLGSGQASALNSDLIDKLKTAERKSTVAPLETKIENIATEKKTFSTIQTKVSELLNTIKPFDLFVSGGLTAFEQKTASATGDSVTFDAADVKALNKGYTSVTVTKLAQKDVYQSNTILAKDKDVIINPGDANEMASKLKINDEPFDTRGKTYKQLADEITAKTGMNAFFEQVGTDAYRLVIKSEDTGLDNKLTISGAASRSLGLDDVSKSNSITATKSTFIGQGNLVINGTTFDTTNKSYSELVADISATSGMNASFEQVGTTDAYKLVIKSTDANDTSLTISGTASSALGFNDANPNHILKAQNLDATVDGVNYNVSSNSLNVNGLKITANKLGDSSINVTEDNTQLETQMNSFITKYNELVALVETSVQSSDSTLGDKATIRSLVSGIKDKLFGSYGDKSVFNYGIQLDKYGGLSLDSTTFNKAVQNDKAGLKDLFAGTAEKKGLGTTLKETLDTMTFSGGLLDTYEKTMLKRETTLNSDKTTAQDVLDKKYQLLANQFAAYGNIINQMESSFSGLKMLISQSTSGN